VVLHVSFAVTVPSIVNGVKVRHDCFNSYAAWFFDAHYGVPLHLLQ